jgi:hypothetical protein
MAREGDNSCRLKAGLQQPLRLRLEKWETFLSIGISQQLLCESLDSMRFGFDAFRIRRVMETVRFGSDAL